MIVFLVSLLKFVFEAFLYVLLIRLLLQKLGESWGNPISQIVVKLTEPLLKPLRKYIPGFKGFDLAIVLAVLVIQVIEIMLMYVIKVRITPGVIGSIVIAIGYLGYKLLNIYIWGIILSVIMTWVPALQHSPLARVIHTITNPLLALARRYVPTIAGVDLSAIPLLLILWIMKLFIFHPIQVYGLHLAYII